MNNCNCGCNTLSQCSCNSPTYFSTAPGQISGELLGTDKIALIQNGMVIGTIPIVSSGTADILDAFGDVIPNN